MARRPAPWARLARLACVVVAFAVPSAAMPAEPPVAIDDMHAELAARVAAVEKDEKAKAAAIATGRDQAVFCAYCHGPDGNSEKPEIPSLAGQNPAYLLDQIERFADGRRTDYTRVMQRLAAHMTAAERLALAVYYSVVPRVGATGDPATAIKGRALYERLCQSCHAADGRGTAGRARVAGQQPGYVVETLRNFRDGKQERRRSPEMSAITQGLSDEELQALAAYIANLR